jgi:hypothetical protein
MSKVRKPAEAAVMYYTKCILTAVIHNFAGLVLPSGPTGVTVVCGIDCLAFQDEFFVNNPSDVKENDYHALYFALRLSCLFRSL